MRVNPSCSPERTAIYRRLNEMIVDDCPAILGMTRQRPYLWHNNVIFYPSENVHGSVFKYAKVLDRPVVPDGESIVPEKTE
jgi:hypothetical protein